MEKQISSVSDYVQKIIALDHKCIRNGAEKHEILSFRGQSNKEFELTPSLGRGRRTPGDISIFNEERQLIETTKYKLPDIFNNNLSPIELLALLQHYGIPTRLLDITENPLVALYFACNANENCDGEVFVFKNNEVDTTNYPIVNAIAESYKFTVDYACRLDLFYEKIIQQPYFLEQRYTLQYKLTDSETKINWIKTCCENPLFVYAPIRSLRQQMQRGKYLLFPNRICSGKKIFTTIIDPLPKNHEYIVERLCIPAAAKKSIIRELKLFGISEEILFCDSTDIVCKNIKSIFTEKVHNQRKIL